MKKYEAPYFSGALPAVALYDESGKFVRYVHKQQELDKWTKPKEEGGPGLTTQYIKQDWPKVMSHPQRPDVLVKDSVEQQKREAEGYSFEHWTNKMAKQQTGDEKAAAPSFDPKAQGRIDVLEAQNKELVNRIDTLLATLAVKGMKQPGRTARKAKASKPEAQEATA